MELANVLAAWVTAIATLGLTIAAITQLPLIAEQVKDLAKQIDISIKSEQAAERRTKEWETLKACERYDFDPIVETACLAIWTSTDNRKNDHAVDRRALICLLNYLDGLGIGMSQGLYLEAVVKDHLGFVFADCVRRFIDTGIQDASALGRMMEYHNRWFRQAQPTSYQTPTSVST